MPHKKHVSRDLFARIVRIRRELHRSPETSFKEHRTARIITKHLDRLHIPYVDGIAGTGIIGRIKGAGPAHAPSVALRADMDGLPIEERTGLPFSSRNKGYMHACGHDGHVAMLLGAAELLVKAPPPGETVLLFQPAEEGGAGALRLIEHGALDGVSMIFGGHIELGIGLGQIALRTDVETSYTDALDIHIVGRGGHAARPHEAVDAVLVASLLVVALQSIVSRTIDPRNPTIISIGSLHAGTVHNAIADSARLEGTVRSTDGATRRHVLHKIGKMALALASTYDATIDVNVTEGYPPVINHPEAYALARRVAERMIGREQVLTLPKPSMGGEDFAYYVQRVPGCFVRLGAHVGTEPPPPSHSSTFDFDERVLGVGAAYYARLAREAMGEPGA